MPLALSQSVTSAPVCSLARYPVAVDPLTAAGLLLALVALSTVAGLIWRSRQGRASVPAGIRVQLSDLGEAEWPARVTMLQFSTEMCARCPGVARALGRIASETKGAAHREIDLTRAPELAERYRISQTPTIFLLDEYGSVRQRIDGVPRPESVRHTVTELLRSPRVDYSI